MTDGNLHCWDFTDCPEKVCSQCIVFKVKSDRCWEFADTQCFKVLGFSYSCEDCRYYQSRMLGEATRSSRPLRGGAPRDAGGGTQPLRDTDQPDLDE